MQQSWGNYFNQYPSTEAGIPVSAMRAAVRPSVFPGQQGAGAVPASGAAGLRPSSQVQPQMVPYMPPQQEQGRQQQQQQAPQNNEMLDDAKAVAGLVKTATGQSDKSDKPDSFESAMASIDAQLQQMKEQRDQMSGQISALGSSKAAPAGPNATKLSATAYGPGSDAKGNEGFGYNVGNLRVSNAGWAGKGAPYNGFETFNTPEAGAAAMYNNLKSYAGDPNMTVSKAIYKWAPPSENDSASYAANVAKNAGIDPSMPLTQVVANPELSAKMMMAMAKIEKGSGLHPAFTHDLFQKVAGGDTGAPTVANKESGYAKGGRVRYLRSMVGGK